VIAGGRRLTSGSHESVRGREKEGYRFGIVSCWAAGWLLKLGQTVSPQAFFYFYFLFFFSFSVFLNSFITFAKMLQFKTNQFLKFYKIHSKVLNQ
jgi:hypothetical protein